MTDESLEQPHILQHVPSVASDGTPFEASGEGGRHMTDTWVDILIDEAREKTRGMNDYSLYRALVQAGYQEEMAEVKSRCIMVAHALSSPNTHAGSIASDALMDLADEINAKIKETGS